MKRFIYVCAFFLCLCSCSESKYIAEELERTQEIINDYPDSALHSLQAIVPGSIRKKSTKAHYGLLYSLALDKTGQTIDTDSMLRPAVNYFMRKGTNRQKFLSWYCLGRMEYSTNNYQKATESYLKALEYRDIIDDPYLIGVCNFVLGELNLKQNNYQRALFYYQEAYENYQAANKTKHQVSAKTAIAAVYYMENEDDNALRDYREALNLSEQFGYKDFQVYCLRCLIGILSNKGVTNETYNYVGRFLQLSDDLSPNDYCVLGEYYLRINKPDSAEYYLNAAISANIGGPRENDAAAKILLAETYTLNADYRAAYLMQKECLALCDSIHLSYMNNSAAETELRYKNERLEFERYRSSVRQNVIYIIALVSVIAICGIIYIFRRRNKMQKQRIEEYLTLIEELNKTKLQIPDAAKISELLNTRFQVLKELAKTYYEFENSPALTKKVKGILSEKILDKTIMSDLKNTLNQQYDNVISNFKSEYPKIKPCFVELLCLLYAGFSPQQISVITNETLKTIYMRKFHLKKKIMASSITTKNAILNIIS